MEELIAFIDSKEQEMLALLERLVSTDCGSYDKAGVDRVGAVLAERIEGLGFTVERARQREHGDHVLGHKPGTSDRRILFVGHMDTVFSPGAAAARPFRVEGGRAYGPGVLDMKGGLVCLLYALEALKATGHPSYETMEMAAVFNSEEEIGSPTSRPIIEAEAKRSHTVCVFEPARPGGEYVVARKGEATYHLQVRGRSAHAGSQPERGRSAILEMAHKILALHALADPAAGSTLNVGVVHGGERPNVVPALARAEIDIRFWDMEEFRRLDEGIRAVAGTGIVPDTVAEVEGRIGFPPMRQSPSSRRLFEALRATGRRLGLDLQGIETGGASDCNYASQFAPALDGMGARGSEAHSDREYIEVASLAERAKVTALFLAAWPETMVVSSE